MKAFGKNNNNSATTSVGMDRDRSKAIKHSISLNLGNSTKGYSNTKRCEGNNILSTYLYYHYFNTSNYFCSISL